MKRILSVANRLPVTVGRTIKKSAGGLVSALEGIENRDLLWIGWPGTTVTSSTRREEIANTLASDYNCYPTFLSRKEVQDYYHGFSNSSLWPLLHYMSNIVRHDRTWWEEYRKVNKHFADIVSQHAREGDLIWVHDYHLMLVPRMIRDMLSNVRIGFFLHTPFPSYEVFRCHPHRRELLQGMLGADLIGFHTFGYMRHFRSAVVRLLGADAGMDVIPYRNRQSRIGVYPIGINSKAFDKELQSSRYQKKKKELAAIYAGKQLVLSVERLDYTKGVLRRLDAIDRFLAKWPDKDNIVFIFVSVPSRGEVPEYQELRERIEGLVGRINGKHSTVKNTPIHFIHKSVGFTELCALYSLADVAMVTPLIDGMNLVAKEYVACKEGQKGVLMLSEFAGAAEELFKCISVNPYDVDQMADRLKQALTVPEGEKLDRMRGMYERVMEYDAGYWANSFLEQLESIKTDNAEITPTVDVGGVNSKRLATARKPAFFLDYDGTLSEFYNDPKMAYPRESLRALLHYLAEIKSIDTYIVSGRKLETLHSWLGEYGFTLVSEHGYRYRHHGNSIVQMLNDRADLSWKGKVKEFLEHYARSTPGSFVEEKISAIVWHYRRSDPEFGAFMAQQLISSLYEIMANLPVEVHHGKKIVEVSSMQVCKGAAMEKFARENQYDFILCAGDDLTDETMFAVEDPNILSIKVGDGDTQAEFRVKNPEDFRRLLHRIVTSLPQ